MKSLSIEVPAYSVPNVIVENVISPAPPRISLRGGPQPSQDHSSNTYGNGGYRNSVEEKSRRGWYQASGTGVSWMEEKATGLPIPATSDRQALWASIISSMNNFLPSLKQSRRSIPSGAPTLSAGSASTARFVLLCSLWYMTSALSSNTGKSILNQMRFPVTLTFVQFGFVAGYCLLFANPYFGMTKIRKPTRAILRDTLPMAAFQVGGHIFSSMAISRIPVSTVHTIKALSPLFTVAAYAILFGVSYTLKTYISLLPLTLGVMLACSFDMSASNVFGLACAFGSAIVFVSSNIFFKKIMPSTPAGAAIPTQKLDKINLLFYSSGMAFLLMIPIWLYYDLGALMHHSHGSSSHNHATTISPHGVVYYFFLNGTVHFAQNIIAFVILSSTSPVTYSIASLVKRIAVICIAIVWFSQRVHPIQGFGICLTFVGLYMYNAAKGDVERGENKVRRIEAQKDLMLPSTRAEVRMMNASPDPGPEKESFSISSAYTLSQQQPMAYAQPNHTHALRPPPHRHHAPRHLPSINTTIKPQLTSVISPTDSYPSPPPSSGSPPGSPVSLVPHTPTKLHRRGTISHNPPSIPHTTTITAGGP